jgi:hypothetical protein
MFGCSIEEENNLFLVKRNATALSSASSEEFCPSSLVVSWHIRLENWLPCHQYSEKSAKNSDQPI